MHAPDALAVKTTNGAGAHNIQMFFLSADGTVLHCLLGYWDPQDFLQEAKLAAALNEVWLSPRLTREQKNAYFKQMQLAHINAHSQEMSERSKLQSFDEWSEKSRPNSDFVVAVGENPPRSYQSKGTTFKTVDEVLHERMACYPFVNYNQFNITAYSNFGSKWYDKHENSTQQELVNIEERKQRVADQYFYNPDRAQAISDREDERVQRVYDRLLGTGDKDQGAVASHFTSVQALANNLRAQSMPVLHSAMPSNRAGGGRGVTSYNWSSQPNGATSVAQSQTLGRTSAGLLTQARKSGPVGLIAEAQQITQTQQPLGLTAQQQSIAPVATSVRGKRLGSGD